MAVDVFAQGEGSAFLLQNCGEEPIYLGCHDFSDITPPTGTTQVIRCKHPTLPNRTVVKRTILQPATDPTTFTVTTDMASFPDELEKKADCSFSLILQFGCDVQNDFTDFDRAVVLSDVRITGKPTITAPVLRDPSQGNDRVSLTFNLEAGACELISTTQMNSFVTAQNENITSMWCSSIDSCSQADDCGDDRTCGDVCYFSTESVGGIDSGALGQVISSRLGYLPFPVDPPFATENSGVGQVVAVELGGDRRRVIVTNSILTAPVTQMLEIWYTEDEGNTWVNALTGTVIGETGQSNNIGEQLYIDPETSYIYLLSTIGSVYRSVNNGISWTEIATGVMVQADFPRAISMFGAIGYSVSETNGQFERTADCGESWSPVIGPVEITGGSNNYTHVAYDGQIVWVTAQEGLFKSMDEGVTWELVFTDGNTVAFVEFAPDNECCMMIAVNTPGGSSIYRSIDGGNSFVNLSIASNNGNQMTFGSKQIHMCGCDEAFAGGIFAGSYAVINPLNATCDV